MLFILISWLYIFAITLVFGISMNRFLKLQKANSVITLCFGFFSIALFTGFWSIFFAVNWQFHVVLLIFSLLALFTNLGAIKGYLNTLKKETQQLSSFLKAALFIIAVLILAQCASPPFVIDNESYYIQTIKWLNDYGLVKGLVNLHLFLGQASGWHILQSAFSFSFLYENFNDLSGLCLLLGNYYAIVKLNKFIKNRASSTNLIIGLFPVLNVFFFQFISAPSPDIAIYVISFIIFYEFIESLNVYNRKAFITIALLSIFLTFIKLTAIIFCLFPLILFVKHFVVLKKNSTSILLFGSLTLVLFCIKNWILTGNMLYPLTSIESLSGSWRLPRPIEAFFFTEAKANGYLVSQEVYNNSSFFSLFKQWLILPKLHGVFNKLILIVLTILPWFIFRSGKRRPFAIIYAVAVINMIFLFLTSPQYRFFIPFLFIFILLIISTFINKKKIILASVAISLLITTIPIFYPINATALTDNNSHASLPIFSVNYFITPHSNSRYDSDFVKVKLENTSINTPTNIDFFWGTGDVPLPAINKQQLEYFKTYFKTIPQQHTSNLKDGFYSKVLNDD